MNVIDLPLSGLKVIEPVIHGDHRGVFLETYQEERYAAAGITADFRQDNMSRSQRGTLRGLHFQVSHPQAKLVSVTAGPVFDVAVD